MKSVYVESSVISYLKARISRDVVTSARQNITIEWWESYRNYYELYISELVIEEISSGDTAAASARLTVTENIAVLVTTDSAIELARTLLAQDAIPANSVEDAMHISIAAVQGIDFLLTWNFKHINNANTRHRIERVIDAAGYNCPVLCSPEELIDDE
jgi:hypothetical protein